MPPQPIKAIWTLSLAATLAGLGEAPASRGTLIPAPAAAVVKNSRREVTLYFLSDEEEDDAVVVLELELELSEAELELPLPELAESEDDLEDSFLSEEPFSDEPSPSFLDPLPPGPPLPLLA